MADKQLEQLNWEIADLTAKFEAAKNEWLSATDPQLKADLKDVYNHAKKMQESVLEERRTLRAKLPGAGAEKADLADEGLRAFAAAAWGSPHKVVDDWVNAPGGTFFLGKAVLGSTLYVRECYTALDNKLEELKKEGIAHVVISGNPGLGKSWFALYMLVRWLGDKIPVMWHQQGVIYLFRDGTVHIVPAEEARAVLLFRDVPGLRYIADGAAPLLPDPDVEQSLVAHSPDESKYKQYQRPIGHLSGPLWMPFWEPSELEALRAKRFEGKVTHVEMQQLIGRRGAVPRLVLDKAKDDTADARIDEAIDNLKEDDVFVRAPRTAQASHRIVRIHPAGWRQGEFSRYELTFLSTEVQLKVVDLLLELTSNNLATLMQATRSKTAQLSGALRAVLLESMTHNVLRRGGRFQISICPEKGSRGGTFHKSMGVAVTSSFTETLAAESSSLEALAADSSATQASAGGIGSAEASAAGSSSTQASAGDSDSSMSAACSEASTDMDDIALGLRDRAAAVDTWVLELPSLPVYHFNNVEELQNVSAGDKYLQPPMNFAAIDSIAIRGGTAYLLQITQNVEHDINVGLLSVLACLPPHVGSVKFVWALPDDVWGHKRFNAKAVPQIADLSRPAVSGTAGHEMRFKSAEASMSATAESAEQGTAAKQHRSDMNIEAIKELVDKNITLVGKCIVACETQYKIAVPLPDYSAQAEPQTSSQPGPQASLSTTGSMARSAAWGFRRGPRALRQLPAWALPRPALPPTQASFASYSVRRPVLQVAGRGFYSRQCTKSGAGGLPWPA